MNGLGPFYNSLFATLLCILFIPSFSTYLPRLFFNAFVVSQKFPLCYTDYHSFISLISKYEPRLTMIRAYLDRQWRSVIYHQETLDQVVVWCKLVVEAKWRISKWCGVKNQDFQGLIKFTNYPTFCGNCR